MVGVKWDVGDDLKMPSSKPTLGVNDLQSQFPEIAAEAFGWDPSTTTAGSNQKKDWKCKEGHIYTSMVNNRTGHKSGCPFCSGRQALKGFNDLKTKFPDVAAEAYEWDPETVTSGSEQKKDWKCREGHIYSSTVSDRTGRGYRCPYCSGYKVLAGFNDLKTKFPDIAAESYGWDPATVTSESSKKKDWKCKNGHIYASVIKNRTDKGFGCTYCSGQQVLAGFNDLKTKFPEIAAEAYDWDSSTVVAGTHQKKDWKCNEGHIYSSTVVGRTSSGRGCPFCSGNQVLAGFNDLKTKFPDIAEEANGWDPETVTSGSDKKKDWKCNKGHIYASVIKNRTINGDGCPFCSGRQVLAGFNDLRTRFPDIAAEAYEWDPSTVVAGASQKKDWKCKQGHIYHSRVADRTIKGSGCPFCSGNEVLKGFNDLKTRFPDIASEAYGWDPTTVTTGSHQKVNWKCRNGHIYASVVNNRTLGEHGCPVCSGHQVLEGFNDLQTKFPDIAAEAYEWDPSTVTAATNQKKDWKCKEGHIYNSSVSGRTYGGNGCAICAVSGFNPEKDAWFYLMQRPGEQQLGISNVLVDRLRTHERNGWTLVEHTIEGSSGKKVQETEALFKKWLKKEIGLMEGTTENWSTTKMEVHSLAELKARSGIETDLF